MVSEFKKALAAWGLVMGLGCLGAQEAPPVISLSQAVDLSLSGGFDQKINQATLAGARASHAQDLAKGSFTLAGTGSYGLTKTVYDPATVSSTNYNDGLPQTLSAGVTLGYQNTSLAVSGSSMAENLAGGNLGQVQTLGLTLGQVVWDGYLGGLPSATLAKSELTWQNSSLTSSLTKLTNVYNLKQSYYTMLSAQEGLDVLQNTLKKQQTTLQTIQAKYDLKQASNIDLKTAQVNVKSAEIDLRNGENTLRAARVRLAILLGKPSDFMFKVASEQDPAVKISSVDEAVKKGLDQRVELQQLSLSQKSSKIDEGVSQTLWQPTVSVSAGYTRTMTNSNQANLTSSGKLNTSYNVDAMNLGVKVALPIWDSGYASAKIDQTRQAEGLYALQRDQKTQAISADIVDAYNSYLIKKDKLDLAIQNADVLGGQYEIVKAQQEAGTAKIQDVLTAEVNFETAQYNVVQARINLQLAALALQYALGSEE